MHAIEELTVCKSERPDEAMWLQKSGIAFEVEEDGHLVVQAKSHVIDFWPATQRWGIRGNDGEQSGLHALIRFCSLDKH